MRPHDLYPSRILWPWNSPGKNTGVPTSLLQGIFQTRTPTQVFCIAGRFYTVWATREALSFWMLASRCNFLSLAENEARNTGPNLRITFLCVGIKETTKTFPCFALKRSWHREEWHLKQKLGNIWGRNSHHGNWGAWAIKAHGLLMTLYEHPRVVALDQYRRFKGRQPWIFIGRTDAEAEALILWPPDAKNRFIGKDTDVGRG